MAGLELETSSQKHAFSKRHRPDFFFHFRNVDHHDGIPRAAVEKASIGPFAEALLAADAENGIDRDAAERSTVFVGHPKHAVFHRTIFHASRRARASRATLSNHRQFF